ncbi:hypothetical protein [Vibrio navarrensis]|uniref:hypothetical protein n=1 Tax=Vibrio navarrensis TaxID=29495 RepID=UPI00051DA177|nr:hypothetical protein [Vibrio navarrensis]KGK16820.1 hypothetical protein EA24_17915 [Vibrio navarrensis]
MKAWKIIVPLSTLLLAGCANPPEVVKPVAYNFGQSEALNKANQTFLTKSYKYGFKTVKSPLKDFTQEEIAEAKTALTKPSGGGVPLLFGALSLATGNLTGVIDIAGGTAASIASSDHVAAYSHWIVALDASEFKNGIEARNHASEVIQTTAMTLLEEKGNTLKKVVLKEEGEAALTGAKLHQITAYTVNDDLRLFGFYSDDYYSDKGGLELGRTNLVPYEQQYVTVRESHVDGGIGGFKSFLDGVVIGYEGIEGYEQYLLDLTARLPKGYLLYLPSFPSANVVTVEKVEDWSCFTCRKTRGYFWRTHFVPAIYTEGKKLEFIQP